MAVRVGLLHLNYIILQKGGSDRSKNIFLLNFKDASLKVAKIGLNTSVMSEHLISLPQNVYEALLVAAQKDNVTPAEWVASKLSTQEESALSLPAIVSDLVGAIDSQQTPHHKNEKTILGEMIAAKLAKQGIYRP